MSLRAEASGPVPEDTARVAQAAFPKGNRYLQLRDSLGPLFDDASFATLFPARGRPAESPWRLALVTVFQFAEGLPDRQAAEAVRARIDWKYALGLSLTDPGFDFTILSDFRSRLIAGAVEQQLLTVILERCKRAGYLKARGQQRTDATHVLGALRTLNRLECVGETLRAALNAIATVAADWLQQQQAADWSERYGRRIEAYRLPKGTAAREAYGVQVGVDGLALLAAIAALEAPPALRAVPAVETLRQLWIQQYVVIEGAVRLRTSAELPPSSAQLSSPYEPEARFASKRETHWLGYKVHLTETCDAAPPHLITQVTTTVGPAADVAQLATIQQGLQELALLPAEQLVDSAYSSGASLSRSQTLHQIALIGPMAVDRQWQAKAGAGFALAQFQLDWEGRVVTCPQGHQSASWYDTTSSTRGPLIHVSFAAADCTPCPERSRCTHAATRPRKLTLRVRTEQEAIQAARQRQQCAEFPAIYAHRAGIEGTLSQGVRAFGLRQARYRGLAKTHLQHVATAAAINLSRLHDFLDGVPLAGTRRSRFAALAATP